jgi:hypothetical protein
MEIIGAGFKAQRVSRKREYTFERKPSKQERTQCEAIAGVLGYQLDIIGYAPLVGLY